MTDRREADRLAELLGEPAMCRSACKCARWEADPRNEPPSRGDPGVNYGMTWMCRGRSGSHAYDVSKATVGSCPGFIRALTPSKEEDNG
jgi:hypothetical protein